MSAVNRLLHVYTRVIKPRCPWCRFRLLVFRCNAYGQPLSPLTSTSDASDDFVCREKGSTALFFQYNAQLGPPYQVLVDTNFINFAIKNKVRLWRQPPGAALRCWSLP